MQEHRHERTHTIERHESAEECLPASAVRRRFESCFIPLSVERVEGDPLMNQYLIRVLDRIVLLDLAEPTARPMKANRGGMIASNGCQPLLVRLPPASQRVNGWGRFVHVGGSVTFDVRPN